MTKSILASIYHKFTTQIVVLPFQIITYSTTT